MKLTWSAFFKTLAAAAIGGAATGAVSVMSNGTLNGKTLAVAAAAGAATAVAAVVKSTLSE